MRISIHAAAAILALTIGLVPPVRALAPLPAGEKRVAVPKDAERRVRSGVPKGWSLAADGDRLVIRRDKPVRLYNAINLPEFPDKEAFQKFVRAASSPDKYEITLRFRPPMSREQRDRLQAVNKETERKLDEWRRVKLRPVTHKFDDYLPSNAQEKRLVAEFRRAKKELPSHRLPDLYTEHYSMNVRYGPATGLSFASDAEFKECEAVRKQVFRLFKAYSPAPE